MHQHRRCYLCAQLVLIPSPAIAQLDIARAMAPHLTDGQVVYLPPGTFGSYVMAEAVRAQGNNAEVSWAETGTLPWLMRKHGPANVAVTMRATRLPTGVYPAKRSSHAMAVIAEDFPCIEPCEDSLSGALMNAGPIIHPPLILMNAAPLQHFEEWDIHNEGTQPAVRAVTDKLDNERIAIRMIPNFFAAARMRRATFGSSEEGIPLCCPQRATALRTREGLS